MYACDDENEEGKGVWLILQCRCRGWSRRLRKNDLRSSADAYLRHHIEFVKQRNGSIVR